MKTKISFAIAAVALVTLSFTFVNVQSESTVDVNAKVASSNSAPVGGFIADEIVK